MLKQRRNAAIGLEIIVMQRTVQYELIVLVIDNSIHSKNWYYKKIGHNPVTVRVDYWL